MRLTCAIVRVSAVALVLVAGGCAAPTTQSCQRYDAVSLTRENGFAASLDWKGDRAVDLPIERLDVALTILRPIHGPVELVHVVDDVETDRWVLTIVDQNNVSSALCSITPPGGTPNCGATLQDLPYFPGGYYYLRPNANLVVEAGLAFYVCD